MLNCWDEISLEDILLLQYLLSNGCLVFISSLNGPVDFVSFVDLSENFLMLNYGCVIGLKHYFWGLNRLHLLDIVDKDRIVFGALKSDLRCIVLNLHILLVHYSRCNLMSRQSFLPG